jgi:ABC-type nitrate/sulfonate/bicarbonate transport system substrate-binding protein
MMKRWALVALAIVVGMTGVADQATAQARKTIKVGNVGLESAYYAPIVVAIHKGFFQQEGLQVESVKLSDPDMVRAVAVGSLPIGIAEVGSGIAAREKGGDVVVVASFLDRYPYDLMVKPAIKTYPDLKGKVLAHWQTSPSVGLELLKRLLAQNGLKDADYKVIAGGNSPARYAALVSGGIDGAILTTPTNTMAKKEGFNALGGLYDIPAVFAAVLANGAWAKTNEADMVAWLRALVRGFHYAADSKNRDEVVTLLTREFKAPTPEPFVHDLKMFYEEQKFLLSWELMPADKSVSGVLDILSAIGQVPSPAPPASKYFELAYLKKAAAEAKK